MNLEELQMILNMVGTATTGAIWVAAIYFIKGFIISLLYVGCLFTLILGLYKFAKSALITTALSIRVRDLVIPSMSGSEITSVQRERVLATIQAWIRKDEEKSKGGE